MIGRWKERGEDRTFLYPKSEAERGGVGREREGGEERRKDMSVAMSLSLFCK